MPFAPGCTVTTPPTPGSGAADAPAAGDTGSVVVVASGGPGRAVGTSVGAAVGSGCDVAEGTSVGTSVLVGCGAGEALGEAATLAAALGSGALLACATADGAAVLVSGVGTTAWLAAPLQPASSKASSSVDRMHVFIGQLS